MDHQAVPNVENVAVEEKTVRRYIDKICYRKSREELIIGTYFSKEPFNDARALELARVLSEEPIKSLDLNVFHLSPTSEGTKKLATCLQRANVQEIHLLGSSHDDRIDLQGSSIDNSTQVLGVLFDGLKGNQTFSLLQLSACGALGDDLVALIENRPPNLTKIEFLYCHLADPYNPRLFRCIGRALHDRYLTSFVFSQHLIQVELLSVGSVELSLFYIGSLPSQWIKDLLTDYSDLRHVSLSGRTHSVSTIQCSMKKLSLKGWHCNLEAEYSLDSILRSRAGYLKEFDLVDLNITLACWQVVISGMVACHGLTSLRVSGCMTSLANKRGALIGRILRRCRQITSLSLKESLVNADLNVLIKDLRTNRTLKSLSLARNHIVSAEAISSCLRHNSSLVTLDLSDNEIRDLTPLFSMLVDRETPTDLFLTGNRCDFTGGDALSLAMERGARLRTLALDLDPYNDADCLACIRFIRGLESQPHLKELDLSWKSCTHITSDIVRRRNLLECLISAIASFQFLEKYRFEWIERDLRWDDWQDAALAAVKQNESLVEVSIYRGENEDFNRLLKFYNLRNRVNRMLESSARGLWGNMLHTLCTALPERTVGMSNILLAFKKHPKLSETAGLSWTKRLRPTTAILAGGK